MGKEIEIYEYLKCNKVVTRIELHPNKRVVFENFVANPLECAFGVRKSPVTYDVFYAFLEDRCFPKSRDGAKRLLKDIGVDFYDPRLIVEKTHGVMFDDCYWIRFEGEENLTYDEVRRSLGL